MAWERILLHASYSTLASPPAAYPVSALLSRLAKRLGYSSSLLMLHLYSLYFGYGSLSPFVPLLGVTSLFHLPALLLCSAEHSLSLVQQRGMTFHLSFAYLLVFTRLPSTPYGRLFSMIRPGLGVPMSRVLEE